MEGFLQIRLRPWVRRLITRSIAIVPAVIVILIAGDGGTYKLLIASQVILSLQLPFAVVPLIQITSDRKRMGEFANPRWLAVLAWIVSAIIIALNGMLLFNLLSGWVALPPPASTLAWFAAVPVAAVCLLLLAWIVVRPLVPARRAVRLPAPLEAAEVLRGLVVPAVRRAGLALDRTLNDKAVLSYGLGLARDRETELVLVHVVAGIGAQVYGSDVGDRETREARARVLAPEDLQLFCQIALLGQADLPLAPDPRTGLEMVLLRALAFRPEAGPEAGPDARSGTRSDASAGRQSARVAATLASTMAAAQPDPWGSAALGGDRVAYGASPAHASVPTADEFAGFDSGRPPSVPGAATAGAFGVNPGHAEDRPRPGEGSRVAEPAPADRLAVNAPAAAAPGPPLSRQVRLQGPEDWHRLVARLGLRADE